jgi:SAM-dependent methyltransferase
MSMHWLLRMTPRQALVKIRRRVIPNLHHLAKSRVRLCRCCNRYSMFLRFSEAEEFTLCMRCGANLRYELLAEYLRERIAKDRPQAIWELDPSSVLRPLLQRAPLYHRTFYDPALPPGAERADGAAMQDVTQTTFPDEMFDLIVSSDVLEHVPDLERAFAEMRRILKPGGSCIFTVPTNDATLRRAVVDPGGSVRHLLPPDYHSDPLNPRGILAFWSLGFDLQERFGRAGLTFKIAKGPEGVSRRLVWEASRLQ